MKLNVISNQSESIENYTNLTIEDGEVNLLNVSDGECEEVILSSCHLLRFSSLAECVKKVSIGGTIRLRGVDLRMLCRDVTNQRIKEEEVSTLIEISKTIIPSKNICNIISSLGFEVDTMNIKGVYYQVCAKRN